MKLILSPSLSLKKVHAPLFSNFPKQLNFNLFILSLLKTFEYAHAL